MAVVSPISSPVGSPSSPPDYSPILSVSQLSSSLSQMFVSQDPKKIYPEDVYKAADSGKYVLAHCTDKDPDLRYISILFTNAIKQVIDEKIRKPIAAITAKLRDNKQMRLAIPKDDLFKLIFDPKWVPEGDLQKSYVKLSKAQNPKGYDGLMLIVSKTELQPVIDDLKKSLDLPWKERPGIVLTGEGTHRFVSLLEAIYWPEFQCLGWFEQRTKQQVFFGNPNPIGDLCAAVAIKAFRNLLSEGFDVKKTAALVVPFCASAKQDGQMQVLEIIEKLWADAQAHHLLVHRYPDRGGMTW